MVKFTDQYFVVTGGLDKNGRCIITIPSNKEQKATAESVSRYEELSTTLQYLDKIPRYVNFFFVKGELFTPYFVSSFVRCFNCGSVFSL